MILITLTVSIQIQSIPSVGIILNESRPLVSPCIICVQYIGDVQFRTSGGYHDACGDIMSTSGDVQYIAGDTMSTLGDIMSTSGRYHDACGKNLVISMSEIIETQ